MSHESWLNTLPSDFCLIEVSDYFSVLLNWTDKFAEET